MQTKSDCKSQNVMTENPVGDGDGDTGMLKEAIDEEKRGRQTSRRNYATMSTFL